MSWPTRFATGSAARSRNESLASKRSGVPASVCTVDLQPDWHAFLLVLKRHGVRFLLVGGHALAAHGRPRFTQDLDVLVDPTPANARRVSAAIAEFGFEETARDWRWFAEPYHITTIGRVPVRIDVLTSISGVSFRAAWRNRIAAAMPFGEIFVLGLHERRANKLGSGRPKDLADLALLDDLKLAAKPRRAKRRGGGVRRGASRVTARAAARVATKRR